MIKVAIFGHFMAANRRVDIDPQIFFFSLYYVKFTNANETLIQPISFTAAQKKQKTKQNNNNTKSIEISCFCEFLCFNNFFFALASRFQKKIILFFLVLLFIRYAFSLVSSVLSPPPCSFCHFSSSSIILFISFWSNFLIKVAIFAHPKCNSDLISM